MSNCEKFKELISASLDGELTQKQDGRLSRHLESCDECGRYHAMLTGMSFGFAKTRPPEDLTDKVMQSVKKEAARKKFMSRAYNAASIALIAVTIFMMSKNWVGPKDDPKTTSALEQEQTSISEVTGGEASGGTDGALGDTGGGVSGVSGGGASTGAESRVAAPSGEAGEGEKSSPYSGGGLPAGASQRSADADEQSSAEDLIDAYEPSVAEKSDVLFADGISLADMTAAYVSAEPSDSKLETALTDEQPTITTLADEQSLVSLAQLLRAERSVTVLPDGLPDYTLRADFGDKYLTFEIWDSGGELLYRDSSSGTVYLAVGSFAEFVELVG